MDGFEQLVVRYQEVVCAVAFAALRDRARSEEVAQEAFLIAWQKLPTMSPPPAMPGWICGIARNLAANAARRRTETAMPDDAEPASTTTPLDTMLDREAEHLAAHALASLPDADREVVVLYYRGDGTLGEVAASLGISEVAARKRLQRGRDRLKTALAAVETALRRTRPGPAFTIACVAALAVRSAAAGAAGSVAVPAAAPMSVGNAVGASLALIAVGALAIGTGSSIAAIHDAPRSASATETGATTPIRRSGSAERQRREDRARTARQVRDALEAVGAELPMGASAATPSGPPVRVYDFAGGALEDVRPLPPRRADEPVTAKTAIRSAIVEVQPLLLECYHAAAPRLVRKDGRLTLTIVLTRDAVGTLVDSADVEAEAHLADSEMIECMEQTLMTLELPAMQEDATMRIHYPFTVGATVKPWARGISDDDQARAQALFGDANRAFATGAHADAIEGYRAALALWDHPLMSFNLAVALMKLGRWAEASEAIDQALRFGADPFSDAIYQQALEYQKQLHTRLGQ